MYVHCVCMHVYVYVCMGVYIHVCAYLHNVCVSQNTVLPFLVCACTFIELNGVSICVYCRVLRVGVGDLTSYMLPQAHSPPHMHIASFQRSLLQHKVVSHFCSTSTKVHLMG